MSVILLISLFWLMTRRILLQWIMEMHILVEYVWECMKKQLLKIHSKALFIEKWFWKHMMLTVMQQEWQLVVWNIPAPVI